MNVVTNPVQSLVSANYIGILVWAVLIGIALRKASDTTKQSLNDISAALSKTVTWIISVLHLVLWVLYTIPFL